MNQLSEEEIINIIENFLNYKVEKYLSGIEVCAISNLLDLYQKEKEKNNKYETLIKKIRHKASGVVSFEIKNGKKFYGPKKNFTRQRLYEDFVDIQNLTKANYIFLTDEAYLQELLKDGEENDK